MTLAPEPMMSTTSQGRPLAPPELPVVTVTPLLPPSAVLRAINGVTTVVAAWATACADGVSGAVVVTGACAAPTA